MPLDPSLLQQGLLRWLKPQPSSIAEGARKFGDAYRAYAGTAILLVPGNPAILDTSKQALIATLTTVFASGAPPAFTLGIDNACVTFWVSAIGSSGFAGIVSPGPTLVPGTLQPALLPVLLAGMAGASSETIAAQMTTALDTWTRAAVSGIPIAGPPPVQIT